MAETLPFAELAKPFRPAMEVRRGFLPPRLRVPRCDTAEALRQAPPVPLLTDLAGEEPPAVGVELRLGWTGNALRLRADFDDPCPRLDPTRPPDARDFWEQDHVELRLFREDESSFQLVAVGGDRFWDSAGLWRQRGVIEVRDVEPIGNAARALEAHVPVEVSGMDRFTAGTTLRGLLARMDWLERQPRVAASSAATLGFRQIERCGEFVLAEASSLNLHAIDPGPRWRRGTHDAEITLCSDTPRSLRLTITAEAHGVAPQRLCPIQLELPAGLSRHTVSLPLQRPRFTRFDVSAEFDGRSHWLGAVTLRAAADDRVVDEASEREGRLFFVPGELQRVRTALNQPPLNVLRPKLEASLNASRALEFPPEDFLLKPDSGNWHRVAAETMVRDGAGNRRPVAAYLWSSLSVEAREVFRDVAGQAEPDEAQLRAILDSLNALLQQRDLYDAEAFRGVRLSGAWRRLIDRGIDALPPAELVRFNRGLLVAAVECITGPMNTHIARLKRLLEAWMIDESPDWPRLATRCADDVRRSIRLAPGFDLHEGNATLVIATAFEAFRENLDDPDIDAWHGVLEELLTLYLETARERRWQTTATANANPVCNAAGGILGMLLFRRQPAPAKEAVHLARKLIWHWIDWCHGDDGGNTEGPQYWQYGTDAFHHLVLAMRNRLGEDDGMLDVPETSRHTNMVRVGLSGDGSMHGVNDTVPMPVGAHACWFLARTIGDELGTWYGDHALRTIERLRQAGRMLACEPSPLWSALVRPDTPEVTGDPPLPACCVLGDIQYAVLRSEPRWDASLVAGLKGSRPPYTHHNQPDTGSFFVDVDGIRMLMDPGYDKPAADDHCLPIIDNTLPVQPVDFVGKITAGVAEGGFHWLRADVTPAYRGAARRVHRTLVMANGRLILIDDIAPAGLTVHSLLQFGGVTSMRGKHGIEAAHRDARVHVEVLSHPAAAIDLKPERSLTDTHWGYRFADCRWFPASVTYQTRDDLPFIAEVRSARHPSRCPAAVKPSGSSLQLDLGDSTVIELSREDAGWFILAPTR